MWLTLAFLSMGLLPVAATRLLQNGLYALDDARTPARLGVLGVVLSAVIGVFIMFPLDRLVVGPDGIEGWGDIFALGPLPDAVRANPAGIPHLGIVGLAIGAIDLGLDRVPAAQHRPGLAHRPHQDRRALARPDRRSAARSPPGSPSAPRCCSRRCRTSSRRRWWSARPGWPTWP